MCMHVRKSCGMYATSHYVTHCSNKLGSFGFVLAVGILLAKRDLDLLHHHIIEDHM